MRFRFENELTAPVCRYFRNRAYYQQILEVPFYEYRMDIYGYSRRSDLTMAVELKMVKWSRAVQQALRYQLCSDNVYIAMPLEQVSRVDASILEDHGLGLIAVQQNRCEEIISPVQSRIVKKHYRTAYLEVLNGN